MYVVYVQFSVPDRFGKGQGQGQGRDLHNLARERQKIGHSSERERPSRVHFYVWTIKIRAQSSTQRNDIWAQFCGRSMKTWAQICKQFTVHRLSENTKNSNYINSGRAQGSSGRAQDSEGRGQGAAPSELCLAGTLQFMSRLIIMK